MLLYMPTLKLKLHRFELSLYLLQNVPVHVYIICRRQIDQVEFEPIGMQICANNRQVTVCVFQISLATLSAQ